MLLLYSAVRFSMKKILRVSLQQKKKKYQKNIKFIFKTLISPFLSPEKIVSKTEHNRLIIPINNNQSTGRETKTVYKAKMANLFGAKAFSKEPTNKTKMVLPRGYLSKRTINRNGKLKQSQRGPVEMMYCYYKQNMDWSFSIPRLNLDRQGRGVCKTCLMSCLMAYRFPVICLIASSCLKSRISGYTKLWI